MWYRSSHCSTSAPINTSFKQSRSLLPPKNSCGVYKTPTTVEPIIALNLTVIDLLLPKPKSCAHVGILFPDVQRNCELKRSPISTQSKAGGKTDSLQMNVAFIWVPHFDECSTGVAVRLRVHFSELCGRFHILSVASLLALNSKARILCLDSL